MKVVVRVAGLAVAVVLASPPAFANEAGVEIMLADALDESRGYCLDIAGGRGTDAPLDKGLQAHTCYNYTGELSADQSFDVAKFGQGQFYIPYYDVCMAVATVEVGAAVVLASCTGAEGQKFSLVESGQLTAQADAALCVTVSSTEKREGRGSSPVHVMRPLSLQACDEAEAAYQTWKINTL